MGIHDLWLFVAAGLLLNITPGPDMALVIARSTRQGTRSGIAAALGVGAGAFVHIAAAAIGLSALLMTSALAFSILKWIGAAYLVWVGLHMLRSAGGAAAAGSVAATPLTGQWRASFVQGFLTNVFNPKVAIFFLAFLPQFIDADAPSTALAFATLGLIFNVTGTLWNVGVAIAASRVNRSLESGTGATWLQRAIGALFIGVGIKLALTERA